MRRKDMRKVQHCQPLGLCKIWLLVPKGVACCCLGNMLEDDPEPDQQKLTRSLKFTFGSCVHLTP